MSKIYVAGKNIQRAKRVMDILISHGHTITFDWIKDIEDEKDLVKKALDERKGVQKADVLVYLLEIDQESARYEAGMAMGLNKKIIISGTHKSFFFSLPEVVCVKGDEEILKFLN